MDKETLRTVILAVIILVTFSFAFLVSYYLYFVEKKKVINKGMDDKEIEEDISKKKKKWQKKEANKHLTFEQQYFNADRSKSRANRIMNSILFVFMFIISAVVVTGYVQVKNNNYFYMNNKTVLVIKSSSMEKANSYNAYLTTAKQSEYQYINTRLQKYSLISIDKYYSGDELKLYDIVAFKMGDTVLVHRLIDISKDSETNENLYTFRGDANNASFVEETKVTQDKIIGKYNGYSNVPLGYITSFIQSEIGIISIGVLFVSLIAYSLINSRIDLAYKNRFECLLKSHHNMTKKGLKKEAVVDDLSPIQKEGHNEEK